MSVKLNISCKLEEQPKNCGPFLGSYIRGAWISPKFHLTENQVTEHLFIIIFIYQNFQLT